MTDDRLAECRQPDRDLFAAADADERVVFAVAARHGVIQNLSDEYEIAAHTVLYLTPDGGRAVEMWVPADAGDLSNIDRATVAPESKLSPVVGFAAKVAPVVNRHPEV